MKGLENHAYLFGLIGFNILALFFLLAAVKWPRLSRLLFFLLFAWACCTNWIVSHQHPSYYLEYAGLTFIPLYRDIFGNRGTDEHMNRGTDEVNPMAEYFPPD